MSTSVGHPHLTDRLRSWWITVLRNDSVRVWISPYCAVWLSWAILALAWFPPVPSLYDKMGPAAYWTWVGVAIPATLAPIAGLSMRHGGQAIEHMSGALLFRDWMGLVLQATGHAVCHVLLVMFQVSAWITVWTYVGPNSYAGLTIFAAVMLLPWTFGTLFLCCQCIYKIQLARKLEETGGVL